MQIKVDSCLAFTQNFSTQLSQVNTNISSLVDGQSKQQSEALSLRMTKLDANEFEEKIEKFDQQLETLRFAVYDSFRVLKATDNYLEKYMPFMVQNLISQNFKVLLVSPPKNEIDEKTGKITLAPDRSEWTLK